MSLSLSFSHPNSDNVYNVCVCALVNPTIKGEWLCQGQNSNISAVIINVCIYKRQVAAVVNYGLHFRHVGIYRFIIDGAEQHTPAIHNAESAKRELDRWRFFTKDSKKT